MGKWDAEATSIDSDNQSNSEKIPPAVLMKGKIKHYNKMRDRWWIVADDVQIRARKNFQRGKTTNKTMRNSLWDIAASSSGKGGEKTEATMTDDDDVININGSVQFLLHDDD